MGGEARRGGRKQDTCVCVCGQARQNSPKHLYLQGVGVAGGDSHTRPLDWRGRVWAPVWGLEGGWRRVRGSEVAWGRFRESGGGMGVCVIPPHDRLMEHGRVRACVEGAWEELVTGSSPHARRRL